jgi:DNA-binding XRE family transcriptional regulator
VTRGRPSATAIDPQTGRVIAEGSPTQIEVDNMCLYEHCCETMPGGGFEKCLFRRECASWFFNHPQAPAQDVKDFLSCMRYQSERLVEQFSVVPAGMTLGDKVETRRNELGLTQAQLARKAGVGTMTLRRIETGQTKYPLQRTRNTLRKLADALGTTMEFLLQAS